jgi:RNA polymerase-binding transcription factor DksA
MTKKLPMANPHQTSRYSDADLAEFKALIEKKMANAREQLEDLTQQILDITENSSDEHGGDWVDDSSMGADVEMLNNMAIRQRRYLQDLENALVRIRNKTYGICAITGELIDKRRLLAVPTTTKSLAAKSEEYTKIKEKQEEKRSKNPYVKKEKQIISRVIRKSGPAGAVPPAKNAQELDSLADLGDGFDDDMNEEDYDRKDSYMDLDALPDQDTENQDFEF